MPEDTSISDLWWLNRKDWREGGVDTMAAFKLGANLMQQKRDNAMKMAEFATQQKEADVRMHGQLLNQKLTSDWLDDMPALQKWMADPSQPPPTDLKSPKSLDTIMQVKDQYVKSSWGKQMVEAQNDYWDKLKGLTATDKITINAMMRDANPGKPLSSILITPEIAKYIDEAVERAPASKPAAVRDSEFVSKKLQEASQSEASGNDEKAGMLRREAAEIQSRLSPVSETIETYTDAEGHQNVRVIKGGTGKSKEDAGVAPTVAFASKTQDRLAKYENAVQLMGNISSGLQAGHIGLRGVVGEYLFDRGLAQFTPKAADKQRIDMRSAITSLREELMRELSSDTQRFSLQDREAISEALPETGVMESLPDAIGKMQRAKDIMIDRSRVYARKLGVLPPPFAMTMPEIAKAFRDGEKAIAAGAKPDSAAFKAHFLTGDEAAAAIMKFFPGGVPTASPTNPDATGEPTD